MDYVKGDKLMKTFNLNRETMNFEKPKPLNFQ